MRQGRRLAALLFTGLLVAALSALGGARAAAEVRILKGPYLQNVTRTSIVVMWETSQPADSRVDFGASADYTGHRDDATPSTVHKVVLSSLMTDTRYHYQVSSTREGERIASADSTFRTAVAPGTPFRFVVYGDTRSVPRDHAKVTQGIVASNPRFVIHTGDLVEDGTEYARWQTEFFAPAAPLLRTTPLYACLGNHERGADWYYRFFSPPGGGGREGEQWYSFDYGDAHFAVVDSDVDFSPGSPQYRWLEADLTAARAAWLFVVHHHPAFSSGSHGSTPSVQRYLVPLYVRYGVDMVFNGHDHLYERSRQDGVTYIVAGGGGAPLYPINAHPNPRQQFAKSTHHFCTVDVQGRELTLRTYASGALIDSVVLRHAAGFTRVGAGMDH